jgi:hypothetical protein
LIRKMVMPRFYDCPCLLKQTSRDDRFECPVSPNPHLHRVLDAFVFQFEGTPVVDVRAYIFRIR